MIIFVDWTNQCKEWEEKYKDLFFLFKFFTKDLYNVHLKSSTYCFIFTILIIKMLLIAKNEIHKYKVSGTNYITNLFVLVYFWKKILKGTLNHSTTDTYNDKNDYKYLLFFNFLDLLFHGSKKFFNIFPLIFPEQN